MESFVFVKNVGIRLVSSLIIEQYCGTINE